MYYIKQITDLLKHDRVLMLVLRWPVRNSQAGKYAVSQRTSVLVMHILQHGAARRMERRYGMDRDGVNSRRC